MATQYTVTYTGGWSGSSAGTNGQDCVLTGSALPSDAEIVSIQYSIVMSSQKYSSSKVWRVNSFYLGSGSPYASYKEVAMSSTKEAVTGSMKFSSEDKSIFDGSVSLHAKVNNNYSSDVKSYMHGVTITVTYELGGTGSTVTLGSSSVDAGEKITIKMANEKSVSHTLDFSFGSKSVSVTSAKGDTSYDFSVPMEWCEEIPNATSGTASVSVKTYYDGDLVGTSTKTFKVNVPESVKPAVSGLTETMLNSNTDNYIQNISGVRLVTLAEGSYGSTIVSYTFSGKASRVTVFSSTVSENTFIISPISVSGEIELAVIVTDSRGRKSEQSSVTIAVKEYTLPKILEPRAYRCDENGTSSEEGTYIAAKCAAEYCLLDGDNSCSISFSYQYYGEDSWNTAYTLNYAEFKQGEPYVIGNGQVSPQMTYRVKVDITDNYTTVTRTVDVSTASYTMYFRKGGTGVAIGKVSEKDYALEINPSWNIWYGKYQLCPVIFSPAPPADPVEGLIWLCPVE